MIWLNVFEFWSIFLISFLRICVFVTNIFARNGTDPIHSGFWNKPNLIDVRWNWTFFDYEQWKWKRMNAQFAHSQTCAHCKFALAFERTTFDNKNNWNIYISKWFYHFVYLAYQFIDLLFGFWFTKYDIQFSLNRWLNRKCVSVIQPKLSQIWIFFASKKKKKNFEAKHKTTDTKSFYCVVCKCTSALVWSALS